MKLDIECWVQDLLLFKWLLGDLFNQNDLNLYSNEWSGSELEKMIGLVLCPYFYTPWISGIYLHSICIQSLNFGVDIFDPVSFFSWFRHWIWFSYPGLSIFADFWSWIRLLWHIDNMSFPSRELISFLINKELPLKIFQVSWSMIQISWITSMLTYNFLDIGL